MDVQTLINSLNADGCRILPDGNHNIVVMSSSALSPEQQTSIRQHKPMLRLLCAPVCSGQAEREAIQFADSHGVEADLALRKTRFEIQMVIDPPEPCECGSEDFRWDLYGDRHCIACEPGQSARVRRLAQNIRDRNTDVVKGESPWCCEHPGDSDPDNL